MNFVSMSDTKMPASTLMNKLRRGGRGEGAGGALYSNTNLQMELEDKALLYWVKVIWYIERPTE